MRLAIAHELTDPSRLVMVSIVRVEGARRKERFDARARADRMIEAAQSLGHWTEGFIFAAMTLGLRKGDLCGLKRSDIDEGRGVLTVSRQRNHTMGERARLKHRTEGQTRVIGLPSAILGRLLGYCRPGAIYLVTRPDGSPPPTNHFDRYLEPVESAAGVKMTPHDFRSAAISALVDAGVDDRAIMDLVGHSSRAMIDWYRDNRPDRTRDALARITR